MVKEENRWLLVWGGQTKIEKLISLILLLAAIVFLIFLFKDIGFKGNFGKSILLILLILLLFFMQKRHFFSWLHRFSRKK